MSNSNSLVRSLEQSMSVKTLKDLVRVRATGESVLLIDVSISMDAHMRNGKRRIDGLREVVKGMKEKKPGVRMVAFGLANAPVVAVDPLEAALGIQPASHLPSAMSQVDFVTEVPDAAGGTPLAEGIDFCRANGFGRIVVVSDGAPNDPSKALESARIFGGKVDVIYVGDPGGAGSSFLDRLAQLTGGMRYEMDLSNVKELEAAVIGLLGTGAAEAPAGTVHLGTPGIEDDDEDDIDLDDDDDEDEDDDDDDADL